MMGRFLPASLIVGILLIIAPLADSQAATRRALLIGINEYLANDPGQRPAAGGTWIPEDLQGAVNDISLMEQVLKNRYGFKAADIRRLEDRDATRAGILQALNEFVTATGPEDLVYIHFSGHGSQVEDQDGDEQDGLDETILPHDARTGDVPDITDDELNRIFAQLNTPNSLIVLDSCHSGTATRGASAMRTRSVPLDPRGQLYENKTESDTSPRLDADYVLMTGAAAYQSALDGPLDQGRYYGLFTLSLGRALGRAPGGASLSTLHQETRREMERIGAEFGLFAVPESQLEGAPQSLGQGIFGEAGGLTDRGVSRLPWVEVVPLSGKLVRLEGAAALAARTGSVWALYPPGEDRFLPGEALSLLEVNMVEGQDAIASIPGMITVAAGSRAVQLLDARPQGKVPVRLDRVPSEVRAEIDAELVSSTSLDLVEGHGFARFIVDYEGDRFVVYGADGLQRVATTQATARDVASKLAELAERFNHVNDLLALDNSASRIGIRAEVNPRDASGSLRGVAVVGAASAPAYRVRRPNETRDASNSLILEIETSEDAYLTIVDIDPAGSVAVLFPNPISQQNGFYPDGLVPGGRAVRIPDGLENNRAGFNWDFVPPLGVDTLRIFAASDLMTAERIRAYVQQLGRGFAQRGGIEQDPRRRLFDVAVAPLQSRGIQVAPAAAEVASDWAATTVTLVIEE